METKFVKGKFVVKINSSKEVIACINLGMVICDEDLKPIDIKKIPKRDGYIWSLCKYAIIEGEHYKDWTVLYSSYKIGQKVYFMKDDKITEGTIRKLVLSTGGIPSYAAIRYNKYNNDECTYSVNDFAKTPKELVTKLLNDYNNSSVKDNGDLE